MLHTDRNGWRCSCSCYALPDKATQISHDTEVPEEEEEKYTLTPQKTTTTMTTTTHTVRFTQVLVNGLQ